METVYHGTTHLFDAIDVGKCKPYKDFGCGFYVTRSYSHAEKIARRNRRLALGRLRHSQAYVYTYTMDTTKMADFNIKNFAEPDVEWMRFVLANRKARECAHEYDIVMGPTANDDTSVVLRTYFDGLYGDVGSEEALRIAIRLIESENLPPQICFTSNSAIALLEQKGTVRTV